jgi:hypothetical protein
MPIPVTTPIVIRSIWYSNAASKPREEFSLSFPRHLDLNNVGEDFFIGWEKYWAAWRAIARVARWTPALEFRDEAAKRFAAIFTPPLPPHILKPQERAVTILDAIERLGAAKVIVAAR